MAYTALYREFRPKTFSEMVGQDHITKTLKNQIIADRVGHAYLFNGGRGTGKTSAAKILARAVNCLHPKEGEPCNECEICKGILSGAITDVVEMDAASNNSVEDIRTIREEVNFLPTIAKYRVYIIDEVHMLSTGAFNALLKTLEEPPEHVKFILATTEPQKLPATILSRCQRFDFKRIANQDIINRLRFVCKEEKIQITEGALKTIATLSEGAMRDALSILERCLQDGITDIDEDYIKDLVGIPKLAYMKEMMQGILQYDVEHVLHTANVVLEEGKDVTNFVWELIKFAKDLLIYKTSKKIDLYSQEDVEDIEKLCNNTDKERLLKIVYDLSELVNTIKISSQKTIIFQAGLIKLCYAKEESSSGDLVNRITLLENKIDSLLAGAKTDVMPSKNIPLKPQTETTQQGSTIEERPSASKAHTGNMASTKQGEIAEKWSQILNDLKNEGKIMLYTNLLNTTIMEINDLTVGIEFPNGMTAFGKTVLEKPDNKNELIKKISIAIGKEINIKYLDLKANSSQQTTAVSAENLISNLDIPFQIIE